MVFLFVHVSRGREYCMVDGYMFMVVESDESRCCEAECVSFGATVCTELSAGVYVSLR